MTKTEELMALVEEYADIYGGYWDEINHGFSIDPVKLIAELNQAKEKVKAAIAAAVGET